MIRHVTEGPVTVIEVAARSTRYVFYVVDVTGITSADEAWLISVTSPTRVGQLPILPSLTDWHPGYLDGYLHEPHTSAVLALTLAAIAQATYRNGPAQ